MKRHRIVPIYIYHAGLIVDSVFVYKNWQFLILKIKWPYLSEFLSPRKLRNVCERANTKNLENEKKFEVGQLHFDVLATQKIRNIYILYIRFEGL